MPDTRGTAYRQEHGKTTVAINRLDVAAKRVDYFHNAGYFRLEGEDFDGLFQLQLTENEPPFLPYTEFARFPEKPADEAHLSATARRLAGVHFSRRPSENPIRAFAAVFPQQVEAVAERPFGFFHKYAFNTLRQVGANFELAADYLAWLSADEFAAAAEHDVFDRRAAGALRAVLPDVGGDALGRYRAVRRACHRRAVQIGRAHV